MFYPLIGLWSFNFRKGTKFLIYSVFDVYTSHVLDMIELHLTNETMHQTLKKKISLLSTTLVISFLG